MILMRLEGKTNDNRLHSQWSMIYFLCTFVMVTIRLLVQLNQWPGSYCVDAPGQIGQALGEMQLNNINPLTSTLAIKGCMDIARTFGGTVSSGIALYTIAQMTGMSLISAFEVMTLWRLNCPKWLLVVSFLFYVFSPVNVAYQVGMWKDTFFAGWMVLFTVHLYYLWKNQKPPSRPQKAILFLECLMVCLARNSGWSALLLWVPFLAIYAGRKKDNVLKEGTIVIGIAIVFGFLIQGVVYPVIFHTASDSSVTALSVPLQQFARVIATNKPLDEDEYELLSKVCDIETIRQVYDETTADYAKLHFDSETMTQHATDYIRLWVRLGRKYPRTYFASWFRQMQQYLVPGSRVWIVDNRIFDNPYGIERTPVIWADRDIVGDFFQNAKLSHLVTDQGRLFWILLFCFFFSVFHAKNGQSLFYLPSIFVYLGLFLTAPISLFRYVYCVYMLLPFFVVWMMKTNPAGEITYGK